MTMEIASITDVGRLIPIASILDGSVTTSNEKDYVIVNVISGSEPDIEEEGTIVCYFIFGDKDCHITGKCYVYHKDDLLGWNVVNKLKETINSVCRIKNFKIDDKDFTTIRSQNKSIVLRRDTLNIEALADVSPTNFLQHIPFEFTQLKDLDAVSDGSLVDVIGITNQANQRSPSIGYDGKVAIRKKHINILLNSSPSCPQKGRSVRLMLFGGYADLDIVSDTVYAVLNAKVETFNNKKQLKSTKNTAIVKIDRDDLEKKLPNHYNEAFVQSLFPVDRQSLKRKINDTTLDSIPLDAGTEEYDPNAPEISEAANNQNRPLESTVHEAGVYDFSLFKPLEVVVKKGEAYKDDAATNTCYTMRSKPRGLALIVDNRIFPHKNETDSTRKQNEHDTVILTSFFQQCDIDVEIHTNVKSKDFPVIISDFKKKFDIVLVDSCFVVVLSYGKENYAEMVDGEFVHIYTDIIYKFSEQSDVFPAMKGKPKVFILQTDAEEARGRCYVSPPPMEIEPKGISNMIVCHPNIPGLRAWSDDRVGSHFIYTLINTMMQHAHNTDFVVMLEKVREILQKVRVNHENKDLNQSSWQQGFGFKKLLFFNPGLE